jgi:DedD protein
MAYWSTRMFTSRSGSPGHSQAAPPESIEAVRRRARHRLIGAAVLVLLGVIGFPLLFDTQPRPIPVDIPIVIPAKNAQPPLPAPKAADATKKPAEEARPAAAEKAAPVAGVAASESLSAREEVVEPAQTTAKPAEPAKKEAAPKVAQSEPKAEPKPEPKAEPKPEPKPVAKPSDAERARALLDGKPADKPETANLRIVVQVGAFADVARAREARQKLERAGLKTYTHVAETAEGRRIRVRVGPFATKAEADKAAARIKALGLPAAILTL